MLSQKDRTTAAKPTPEEGRDADVNVLHYNALLVTLQNQMYMYMLEITLEQISPQTASLSMLVIIFIILIIAVFIICNVYLLLALGISWHSGTLAITAAVFAGWR